MATTTRKNITLVDEGDVNKIGRINDAINAFDAAVHTVQVIDTVANLPAAADNENALAIATDVGPGNETWLVYSDGTDWRQIVEVNNTIVSA